MSHPQISGSPVGVFIVARSGFLEAQQLEGIRREGPAAMAPKRRSSSVPPRGYDLNDDEAPPMYELVESLEWLQRSLEFLQFVLTRKVLEDPLLLQWLVCLSQAYTWHKLRD